MNQTELVYEKTNGLAPYAYAMAEDGLYFCDQYLPGLFRYDFESEESECVAIFDRKCMKSNFVKIFVFKDELWLLPILKEKLVCFNKTTYEVFYYDIPKEIEEEKAPFLNIFSWKEKAYIVPRGNNRFLIELDLLTHNMRKLLLLERNKNKRQLLFNGAVQIQDKIYLQESTKELLILYDISNEEIKFIHTNGYQLENVWPEKIKDKIYFFPIVLKGNEKMLIYDCRARCFNEEEYPIKNFPQEEVCITLVYENHIWILANKQKRIYRMNHKLEIEREIFILNFNGNEKEIYVSGQVFPDCFFWNGYQGNPLIQVKGEKIKMLDVCKDKTLLEVYIEIVKRDDGAGGRDRELNDGKLIYDVL